MIDFEREEWNQNGDLRRLLERYQDQHTRAKQENAEFDGWLTRIKEIEGSENADLSRLHGQLIAMGLLKFQLLDRKSGVRYQINPAGKQALNRQVKSDDSGQDARDDIREAA